jgi:peptide/nickel transport system permease protein
MCFSHFRGDHDYIYYPEACSSNPVEVAIARVSAAGQHTAPEAVEEVRRALIELYGLEGSIWQQYLSFWGRLLKADLGPSYSSFPTPVIELIKVPSPGRPACCSRRPSSPGSLGTSSVELPDISVHADGARRQRFCDGHPSDTLLYYGLCAVDSFRLPCPHLPSQRALDIGVHPSFSLRFLTSLLRHAFLPSLSLVIVGPGGWILGMESLVSNIIAEDYVVYAKTAGVSDSKLLSRYVMRNALLPQVTGLALQVGLIFNGALITEYVFSYPGLGYLAYNAIFSADYSLIIGIAIFSIVGVAFAVLIVDLAYPLFDPRIQYR